jgi:hypothetical protein
MQLSSRHSDGYALVRSRTRIIVRHKEYKDRQNSAASPNVDVAGTDEDIGTAFVRKRLLAEFITQIGQHLYFHLKSTCPPISGRLRAGRQKGFVQNLFGCP